MSFILKGDRGKKKAIAVTREIYDRAVKFADAKGYTIGSVVDTALEELLADYEDEVETDAAKAPPAKGAK